MKTKIIKFQKIYSFNRTYFFKNFKKQNRPATVYHKINTKFKTAIKNIYDYNYKNKLIWFIGIEMPVKYKTKHVFLPKSVYIKGLISNTKYISLIINKIKKTYTLNLTKPDLVVIFSLNETSILLLKELSKCNIPVIVLGSQVLKLKYTPFIYINQNVKKLHSFFSFIIHSILKKKNNK